MISPAEHSALPSLMRYSAAAVYFEHDRKEMLPFIPVSAMKALEIGCGSGGFGAQIKKRQPMEYWGIELSETAARAAAARLDKVFCGTVEQYYPELPDRSFDLLVLNDVLEHLQDPYLVLAQLLRKLKPEGLVVASIPNVLFIKNLFHLLVKKDWRYEDSGIRDRTHLRFFTRKSAVRMFEELGLKLVHSHGILPTHQPFLFGIFNVLTLGHFAETRYTNFAVVARLPR